MKIIDPSAHIEELPENIYQRIDKAASVCYQRPEKPTVEEAMEFCRGIIKRKHWMPLEFATVHLVTTEQDIPYSQFIHIQRIEGERDYYLATGSIRAFMELKAPDPVMWFLSKEFPMFFTWVGHNLKDRGVEFAWSYEIPWEHEHVAVHVVCSRAISHQLVRHRPCAILQESQRYCRYDGKRFDGEVSFIRPIWTEEGIIFRSIFLDDCAEAESRYFDRLNCYGLTPQQARGALNNDTKTELLMYANLPEWQHILNEETMRCSPHADPEMQRIMKPLREEFKARWPERF